MLKILAVIMVAISAFSGCGVNNTPVDEATDGAVEIQDLKEEKIEQLLSTLTIEEKICQMMFVTPEAVTGVDGVTVAGETTRVALEKYPVGGIIYFAANIKSREQVTAMIQNSQNYSKIPLFIGVDEEGGRVARLGNKPDMGTSKLPAMKYIKSKEEAYQTGKTLGEDLSGLGFNVDFAPVADVIVNENNSEIGDRSFGTDPAWVSEMVAEVVIGLEEQKVSSVLKHFPGHGSTQTNSHTGYSESYRTVEELRTCEFLPFREGIAAGCDFVMVSHMTLVNATKEKLPSSLSEEVIGGFLKGEIGFEGIVITDSLSMGAITKEFTEADAAVMAVKAGADMLLMPRSVEVTKSAILEAVNTGVITEDRIEESVRKILKIKIEKGLI